MSNFIPKKALLRESQMQAIRKERDTKAWVGISRKGVASVESKEPYLMTDEELKIMKRVSK
jgi:hypothetical protein